MTQRYFDNTIISSYKRCPREYYWRHIRKIRGKGTSLPLAFGLSWHSAMDAVWKGYYQSMSVRDLVDQGMDAFLKTWSSENLPVELSLEQTQKFSPRTPMVAREMLFGYLEHRQQLLSESILEAVEQPFAVPLFPDNPDLWYIGRLDKVFKLRGRRLIAEHKTSSEYKKDGGFRETFLDNFALNSQSDGYLYAGHLYFENFEGVWIDAALVHKEVHDAFKIIPLSRATAAINSWLVETQTWVQKIFASESDMAAGVVVEQSFPRNTENCIGKYGKCPYFDLCRQYPDAKKEGTPEGFIEEEWKPFETLGLDKAATTLTPKQLENKSE